MSRRASVDSPQPSSPHPSLTAALGCMDVQLEAELARYRHQQAEEQNRARSSQQASADPYPQLSLVNAAIAQHSAPETVSPGTPHSSQATPIVPPELQTEQEPTALANRAEGESTPLSPPEEQPTETLADANTQLPPDDYLASSEQLLRNLDREQPPQEKAPGLADYLLTPLGIGAMLVLLVATTLLGAALMEPEKASQFGLGRFFKSQTSASSDDAVLPVEESDSSATETEDVALDIDNLSKIQPSSNNPAAANPASPNPSVPGTSAPPVPPPNLPANGASDLTRALVPPTSPPPQAQPAPAPAPSNTASAPTAAAPAPKSGDPYYFVIIPYAGAGSLQQAQAAVPDAYLRKFDGGTSIQMGALPTRQNADRFVEQLKQQGLSASVYRAQ